MKNIFDWLKCINKTKPPAESFSDKDWDIWNSYIVHRFMSMNPDFIEIVNLVQDFPPTEKQAIYKDHYYSKLQFVFDLDQLH